MATGPHDFSNAETRPTRVIRAREGWGGCFTIGFSLLGVILCVGVALGVIAATRWPRMLDRYLSLEPGNASLYRVTYGNGVTGFLSANTVKPNRDSITYAAVQGQGGDAVQVHTIATNWGGQIGQIHNRDDMYARESDSLVLIAQREDGTTTEFLPPLLIWSPNLLETTPSQPLIGQVTFNDTRFDYKLWLDGRETVTLPDDQEVEAFKIGTDLICQGILVYQSFGSYVSGVGLVREEDFDGEGNLILRLELITSTRLSGSASLPLADLLNNASTASGFFRENTSRTGAHQSRLPDARFNVAFRLTLEANFTASPIVAGGLLFVADQNGSIFALDAQTAEIRWQFGLMGSGLSYLVQLLWGTRL